MTELEKQQNNPAPELINIEWQAPEFEKHEKGPKWFILVGIFALAIFTISLFMKNYIFAAMIIIAVFTIFIYALKEPRVINFKIDGKGIAIAQKLYSYSDLESFWIFYEPPQIKELSIKSKKWLMPFLKIHLADQNPLPIRQALIKFIPEELQKSGLGRFAGGMFDAAKAVSGPVIMTCLVYAGLKKLFGNDKEKK